MKFVDFMADSRDFYTGLIDPVCKKYGLTQMEFNILLFLANNPECDTAAPDAVRTYEPDQFKHLRLQERRKTA